MTRAKVDHDVDVDFSRKPPKIRPPPNDQPPPFSLGLNADSGSLDHADDDYQLKVALFLEEGDRIGRRRYCFCVGIGGCGGRVKSRNQARYRGIQV